MARSYRAVLYHVAGRYGMSNSCGDCSLLGVGAGLGAMLRAPEDLQYSSTGCFEI